MMNEKIQDRQELRKKFIRQLNKMRGEAYSGLTCIEFDAIGTLLHFLQMKYEINKNDKR